MRQHLLLLFFVLVFAVTWVSWGLALAGGPPLSVPRTVLIYLGTFAPGIVALVLTALMDGKAGVAALLARLVKWDVGLRWYLFALTYVFAIKLTAALVIRLATGHWPPFGTTPWYLLIAATLGSTILFGQVGEELGWRGYALPRLVDRFGLGLGSILLGVIWAVWHLPLFLLPGTDSTGQSFPLYLIQVMGLSVAIAWVYFRTGGSLLLTMLLHAAVNNTKDIVPSAASGANAPFTLDATLTGWVTVGLLWITVVWFLARMPRRPRQPQV